MYDIESVFPVTKIGRKLFLITLEPFMRSKRRYHISFWLEVQLQWIECHWCISQLMHTSICRFEQTSFETTLKKLVNFIMERFSFKVYLQWKEKENKLKEKNKVWKKLLETFFSFLETNSKNESPIMSNVVMQSESRLTFSPHTFYSLSFSLYLHFLFFLFTFPTFYSLSTFLFSFSHL